MASAGNSSLINLKALGLAVRNERDRRGIQLKDIAAEAGVDGGKLSNLTRGKGGLSTDNIILLCDWLGEPLETYRVDEAPKWLAERLAKGNGLSVDEARRLAENRAAAAKRQAGYLEQLRRSTPEKHGAQAAAVEAALIRK